MLKGIAKYRPRHLFAVYVEDQHIEVLRASRQWRTWRIESEDRIPVSPGDTVYDTLQHLNLRPAHRAGSALVLFLPGTYCSAHREHYPAALENQLEETLHFDWQENLFNDHELTLHFFGTPVPVDHQLSVPIFWVQRSTYDKFYQALDGSRFHTFTVVPTALNYEAFLPQFLVGEQEEPLEIVARQISPSNLEVHRFYNGAFLDSILIGKNFSNFELFRQSLLCIGNETCQENVHIHLVCTDGESSEAQEYCRVLGDEGIAVRVHPMGQCLISHWVRHLLGQDRIHTFDTELLLKPWSTPKVIWPLMAVILLFSLFGFYQVRSADRLAESNKRLKRQVNQLETQWKPIEALQGRISKFEEDQKTLSEFNKEGYPLLELLTLLTQVTSDDTWLNYLSLRKGQLILRGESKSAIKYLSDLSKTDGMTDVKFASPVTRNPSSDQERFNVQLQLDSDKLQKVLDALGPIKAEGEVKAAEEAPLPPDLGIPAPDQADIVPDEDIVDENVQEEPPESEQPEQEQ